VSAVCCRYRYVCVYSSLDKHGSYSMRLGHRSWAVLVVSLQIFLVDMPLAVPGSCSMCPIHFLAGWHKGDLNQALVSSGLVLFIVVVCSNCFLGFLCCRLVAVIFVLLVLGKWPVVLGLVKWLAEKIVSRMTLRYVVSRGTLNRTVSYIIEIWCDGAGIRCLYHIFCTD